MSGFVPDEQGFRELARRGRLAFVYREVVADSDTPVSAYAKLGRTPYSFLLESVSFDRELLADLPPTVDPCGERGEFHTFAHAGPMFDAPIPVTVGRIVERDGFVFADLQPG